MIALKNVLVATDFGDAANTALEYGRALARDAGASLHVLHVADDVLARVGTEIYTVSIVDLQREMERDAVRRVEQLITENDRAQLHATTAVRTSRSPADAIAAYAREHPIDLIVVGTHGRGGAVRLLLGSVAERIVRIAPCPVLVVRTDERDFVQPDVSGARSGAPVTP